MPLLKLIALDQDDLMVVSAHLQDAVIHVGDLSYMPKEKRFLAVVNRYDWQHDAAGAAGRPPKDHQRRRTALRFEHVTAVRRHNIVQASPTAILSLLAMQFAPAESPSGHITLVCSGGGALRLEVDCIEMELRDLGPVWTTANTPAHDLKDAKS